jgi:hypothetical protein
VASTAIKVKKLKKDLKSIKIEFTMVNNQLEKLKESDSEIASHFQVDQALQFAQVGKKFKPKIAKLFKQAGSSIKLDLRGHGSLL